MGTGSRGTGAKEKNIQPLTSGRKVSSLSQVLATPLKQRTRTIHDERE